MGGSASIFVFAFLHFFFITFHYLKSSSTHFNDYFPQLSLQRQSGKSKLIIYNSLTLSSQSLYTVCEEKNSSNASEKYSQLANNLSVSKIKVIVNKHGLSIIFDKKTVVKIFQRRCFNLGRPKSSFTYGIQNQSR